MTVEDWLASSCDDADRRGLPELKPLLSALAKATLALRAVDWDGLLSTAPPPCDDTSSTTAHAPQPGEGAIR